MIPVDFDDVVAFEDFACNVCHQSELDVVPLGVLNVCRLCGTALEEKVVWTRHQLMMKMLHDLTNTRAIQNVDFELGLVASNVFV